MAFYNIASAKDGELGGHYGPIGGNDSIVAAPAGFPGNYAYKVDPVNGTPVTEFYGYHAGLDHPATKNLFLIPFMFMFDADFDEAVSIAELDGAGSTLVRRLMFTSDERLQIMDTDEDTIGQTAINYVANSTVYWCLWLVDIRSTTHDALWVFSAGGAWDKAIDVSGHGDIGGAVAGFTFGTSMGKGLPTLGGPFYISEGVQQTLNETPNDTPLGSITTRYKVANGINSTADDDFAAGAGAANPSHLNVDEIPKDDDTTYDQGDAAGEHQSYAVEDADGGHTPLALQVIGAARQGELFQPNISLDTYIYDGSSRDFSAFGPIAIGGLWQRLLGASTYNQINGVVVASVTFNDLEVGAKITARSGSSTLRLTQIGIEYLVEGPKALPGDFPEITLGDRRRMLAQAV